MHELEYFHNFTDQKRYCILNLGIKKNWGFDFFMCIAVCRKILLYPKIIFPDPISNNIDASNP